MYQYYACPFTPTYICNKFSYSARVIHQPCCRFQPSSIKFGTNNIQIIPRATVLVCCYHQHIKMIMTLCILIQIQMEMWSFWTFYTVKISYLDCLQRHTAQVFDPIWHSIISVMNNEYLHSDVETTVLTAVMLGSKLYWNVNMRQWQLSALFRKKTCFCYVVPCLFLPAVPKWIMLHLTHKPLWASDSSLADVIVAGFTMPVNLN